MPAVSSATEFRTKTQVAYEQIHSWILRGDLAPGEVVDQERLASLLDISRMPLRQALMKLEADGLIEVRAHRSAVISPLRPSEIEELYATRAALEAMLADVGSSRCTPSDVEEMREIVRAMEQAESSESLDEFVDLDRRFHGLLYRASG